MTVALAVGGRVTLAGPQLVLSVCPLLPRLLAPRRSALRFLPPLPITGRAASTLHRLPHAAVSVVGTYSSPLLQSLSPTERRQRLSVCAPDLPASNYHSCVFSLPTSSETKC